MTLTTIALQVEFSSISLPDCIVRKRRVICYRFINLLSSSIVVRVAKERVRMRNWDKYKIKAEKGFTLIEIMVVIAIVAILAAIAIPQFAAYRTKSYNAALKSDAHALANIQEAYFTEHGTYASTTGSILIPIYGVDDLSGYTRIVSWNGNGVAFSFRLTDTVHTGVETIFFNSEAGGLQ